MSERPQETCPRSPQCSRGVSCEAIIFVLRLCRLEKKSSVFYLCPETLSKAKYKSNGLINLAELSKQQSWTQAVSMVKAACFQPGLWRGFGISGKF